MKKVSLITAMLVGLLAANAAQANSDTDMLRDLARQIGRDVTNHAAQQLVKQANQTVDNTLGVVAPPPAPIAAPAPVVVQQPVASVPAVQAPVRVIKHPTAPVNKVVKKKPIPKKKKKK